MGACASCSNHAYIHPAEQPSALNTEYTWMEGEEGEDGEVGESEIEYDIHGFLALEDARASLDDIYGRQITPKPPYKLLMLGKTKCLKIDVA